MLRALTLTCLTAAIAVPAVLPPEPAPARAASALESDAQLLIFHAVLEGLYTDGVSNEVVDAITELDGEVQWPKHFIYACPICMPAFNAFRSYRVRPVFFGDKQQRTEFGPGLDAARKKALLSDDLKVRHLAIKDLVKGWVERRLKRDRLTEKELAQFERRYEEYAKKGLGYLQSYQQTEGLNIYDHMEYCPLCVGATEAVGH